MSLSKEELKLKELVAAKISLQENLTQLESQVRFNTAHSPPLHLRLISSRFHCATQSDLKL